MSIDIKVCIARCLRKPAFRHIDWYNGVSIADIYLIGRNANIRSVSLVSLVNCRCFVPYIGMIVEPQMGEFRQEWSWDVGEGVEGQPINGSEKEEESRSCKQESQGTLNRALEEHIDKGHNDEKFARGRLYFLFPILRWESYVYRGFAWEWDDDKEP